MANKHVFITVMDGCLEVNPETVHVSISQGESVVWHCPGGTATASFRGQPGGSPFMGDEFYVAAGGSAGSGPPVRGKVGQHYKYSVSVRLLNDRREYKKDPDVIVDNGP